MPRAESTRRVFLIGFMGAGKTTVGKALAARLGWKFCDLDQVIEQREGKSVAAIFADQSEAGFRRAEAAALLELMQESFSRDDLVVALGGGTFAQAANRDVLDRAGALTILLDAPLNELRKRCMADGTVRPLLQQEQVFAELFAARRPAYDLARHRVETADKTAEQVAAEIEQILLAANPEVKL